MEMPLTTAASLTPSLRREVVPTRTRIYTNRREGAVVKQPAERVGNLVITTASMWIAVGF
jgi:hypothetical protein